MRSSSSTERGIEHIHSRSIITGIARIISHELRNKGVDNRWCILTINDKDCFESPCLEVCRQTAISKQQTNHAVTTVLIPPSRAREEIAQRRNCTCPNRENVWHKCVKYCAERYGCTGGCKARTPKQPNTEKPVEILQGFWGPLNGEHQSTPRAELGAIATVLEHADPPICIVTDHQNHVKAYKKGRRHCCKITSPMLDI